VKLVLFDIDGTILLTDGAGKRAIHRALLDVFGSTGPADHRFDGKTDPQIVRELMRIAGHADEKIDAEMASLFGRYVDYLQEELRAGAEDVRVMPGVIELLDALDARHDATLGLLTGNLIEGNTLGRGLTTYGTQPNLRDEGGSGNVFRGNTVGRGWMGIGFIEATAGVFPGQCTGSARYCLSNADCTQLEPNPPGGDCLGVMVSALDERAGDAVVPPTARIWRMR